MTTRGQYHAVFVLKPNLKPWSQVVVNVLKLTCLLDRVRDEKVNIFPKKNLYVITQLLGLITTGPEFTIIALFCRSVAKKWNISHRVTSSPSSLTCTTNLYYHMANLTWGASIQDMPRIPFSAKAKKLAEANLRSSPPSWGHHWSPQGHFLCQNNKSHSRLHDNADILYMLYNNHSENTHWRETKTMSVSTDA